MPRGKPGGVPNLGFGAKDAAAAAANDAPGDDQPALEMKDFGEVVRTTPDGFVVVKEV